MVIEIKSIGDNVGYDKLLFAKGNKKVYSFNNFKTLEKLIKDLHNRNMTIDEAGIKQNEFAEKLDKLRAYPARGSKYIGLNESVSKYVKKNYDGWEKNFYGFRKGISPLSKNDDMKLIAVTNNQIFQTHLNRQNLMTF